MYMIINTGSNSNVSAENVKYGDYSVAETLDGLKFSTNFLSDYVSSVDDSVGNVIDGLTANGQRIYMDYKDGQYGYNTSASRGADTFSPFKSGSDGRMIPYLEVGTSDEASAECSIKLNCKGCKTLHIDSIVQTNGTNYGSITFENDVHIQTELDKPQYNYSLDISEWASTHDLIELYIYTYKCRFNMTNIYCD